MSYKTISDTTVEMFANDLDRQIVKPDFTSCWIWFGQRDRYGYGVVNSGLGHFFVHRLMYQRFKGDLQESQVLRHTCDYSSCCNPEHLIPGTQQDNIQDAYRRGRTARGERVKGAKLTAEKVREIRSKYIPRRGIYAELGREYGIDGETVRGIISRHRWAHID